MDGKTATLRMARAVNESGASSSYLSQEEAYGKLDEAAVAFARDTMTITNRTSIAVSAGVQAYDLPPDFLGLYLKTARSRRFFVKYRTAAGDDFFAFLTTREKIEYANQTEAVEAASAFAITDKQTAPSRITGTATGASVAENGECTLAASGADFSGVFPRDIVRNTTDAARGIVLSRTDATHLVTALFSGTRNNWSAGDGFLIQSSAVKQILLYAPPQNDGDAITVDYLSLPSPMYSEISVWRFAEHLCPAVCELAAALFLEDKKEYPAAQLLRAKYEAAVRKARTEIGYQKLQGGLYPWRT
ncbi:MAG: hypothetical protein AB1921_14585 [Thermodesulfobacteriota bacterium]